MNTTVAPPRIGPSGRPILSLRTKPAVAVTAPAEPVAPPPPLLLPSRKQALLTAARAVQVRLAAQYPALFVAGQPRRPLVLGVREQIQAALPDLDPAALALALRWHCGSASYVATILEPGAPRYGLDGSVAGVVTEAEVAGLRASRIKAAERRAARCARQE
jgi:sRNA-binding protein